MSANASSPTSFKAKKKLNLTPKSDSQDTNSLSTSTPDKPSQPPRRSRRGFAFSIKEVREAAQNLRERKQDRIGGREVPIKSARKQILSEPDEISVRKSKSDGAGGSIKLPEKYEILGEFFDSLDSSVRLSRLKGSMSSFTNIRPKIETLTDRRFTYGHLAQLKFILPEAIELKKVLVFDEKTSCMKPDIHVTLNVDAIEVDEKLKCESKNIHLRKVFRARLLDFFKAHPEGDDVPEEALPVPFHHSKQVCSSVTKLPNSPLPVETPLVVPSEKQPVKASHLSQSFQRRFSQRNSNSEAENSHQKLPSVSFQPNLPVLDRDNSSLEEETIDSIVTSPVKLSSKPTSSDRNCTPTHLPVTPSKPLDSTSGEDSSPINNSSCQSTPAKLVSTPARLMSVTPALPTPKRCYMSSDSKPTSSSDKLVRRAPRTRSLKFDTPKKSGMVENEADRVACSSYDNDFFDILPQNLIESIREKEKKTLAEQDPAISQAKRRKQMIGSLPKLFNMIHFLFQSINRSVITKEELIHKIIVGHCDVVDKREVEEQLNLLLELVPEWISEKSASGGDLLFCIKKTSNPESIRARLAEAKIEQVIGIKVKPSKNPPASSCCCPQERLGEESNGGFWKYCLNTIWSTNIPMDGAKGKKMDGAKGKKEATKMQREFLEFRTPQHPSLGSNHWGGASPLLARNVPKESLEQKYLMLNSIRICDEIFPYAPPSPPQVPLFKLEETPVRRRRGILSKIGCLRKKKVILGWNSKDKRWFPRWDHHNRWPQGW